MVMSAFRLKVEIRLFCTCPMKNVQYNHYLWLNCQYFCAPWEIGVEEHGPILDRKWKYGRFAHAQCIRP